MATIITLEADVKRLIGKEIPAAKAQQLADAIAAGDREIVALTGQTDWTSNITATGKLQNIGAIYAAYTYMIGLDKEEWLDKAKQLWTSYTDSVAQFHEIPIPEDMSDPNFDYAVSESENPYVNPDKPFFMSQY